MMNTETYRDLHKGISSSILSTVATNGLLHWHYCKVTDKTFFFRDMWRGFSPNCMSYLGSLGTAYVAKGLLERHFNPLKQNQNTHIQIIQGIGAGSISSIGACPGERLATLDNKLGRGWVAALNSTLKQEGVKGLYRGFVPTVARDAISIGCVLSAGPLCYERVMKSAHCNEWLAVLISSVAIGTGSSLVTQPFQVIRINMQNDPKKKIAEIISETKGKNLLKRIKPFTAGAYPRIIINCVLIACGIIIDDCYE